MSNVQQPEMRRSGQNPLVTDSVKDKAQHTGPPDSDQGRGKKPQEQSSPHGPKQKGKRTTEEPTTKSASKRRAQPGTPGPSG